MNRKVRIFVTMWKVAIGLCFLVGLVPSGSMAQVSNDTINQTDDQGRKQGYWVKYYPNGKERYQGYFKDDLPVGLMKRYFETGNLQAEMVYAEDGFTAEAKIYHPNAKLIAKGRYLGQDKDGPWDYFNEDGQKTSHEEFRKGVKHGTFEEYYPRTGSVVNRLVWKDGIKEGAWLQQFDDGTPKVKGTYVNDHLEGEVQYFYPSGKLQMAGKYVEGKKDGTWKYYLEDGRLGSILVCKGMHVVLTTRINGTFTEYHGNRIPSRVMNYKNGKMEGEYLEYYSKGEWVVVEETNKDGEVERVEKLEGQQLKMKANYKEGKLEGEVTHYREDGSVERIERYLNGEKQ